METDRTHSILVVDDNPTNLSLLFDYLGQLGYHIFTAESGESALKRMEFIQPDLILLDIMMPGMDGFEVARRIQNKLQGVEIPLIFMTALDDVENKVKAFSAGAVDYITKPIQHEEVRVRIETHLRMAQLREDLRREVAEKDRAIAELDAFSQTVAHELKSPINSLVGFSDLLMQDTRRLSPEERTEMLRILHESGLRMRDLVDDLLTLARVRTDTVEVERVHMLSVLRDVLERLDPNIRHTGASVDLPRGLPDCVGFTPWIERVWENLISNALKYGGAQPQILIRSRSRGRFVEFSVSDNGPGIAPEDLDRLFLPFVRLNGRVAGARREGHGLGLSIVRRIIERLDGRIGAQPNPEGSGTRFYFHLPKVPRS